MLGFLYSVDVEHDGGEPALEDEILALAQPSLAESERDALRRAGFEFRAEDRLGSLGGTLVRLGLPFGVSLDEALARARDLAPSADIDRNHLYRPGAAPCQSEACWQSVLVGLDRTPQPHCSQGAPLAIVDTPVETATPALAGTRIVTRNFLPAGLMAATPDHATAIAALLVGRPEQDITPLAPNARLLVAEAVRRDEEGERADAAAILRGIDWAIARDARVVGLSLAGPPNRLLELGVRAVGQRANLVAAAGNDGPFAEPAYPAAYPEVMAVSAVDSRQRPYRHGTRGDYVEIAAPGVGVISVAPGGTRRVMSGSSFAVPFVAAALLRARAESGGDADEARRLLHRTARDLGAPGHDPIYGYGLLQVPFERCW